MSTAAAGFTAAADGRLSGLAPADADPFGPVLAVLAVGLGLVVVAGSAAIVARRRATRAFDRLIEVVRGLSAGEFGARAPVDAGPAAVRALARAINQLAGTVGRERAALAEAARLADETARLAAAVEWTATRLRRQPSIQAAMDSAAGDLGDMLAAGRVTVRFSDPDGDTAVSRWRPGPPGGPDPTDEPGGPDEPDGPGGPDEPDGPGGPDEPDGPGGPDEPDVDWAGGVPTAAWVTADLRTAEAVAISPRERAALVAAGAGPTLVVPFEVGARSRGVATLTRAAGSAPWSESEVAAVRSVTTGLGDAVRRLRLRNRENDLVIRLMEMDDAKMDLMRTISHELRTPLASVVGYVETLREGAAGPVTWDQDRMLAVVERNAERLRALIESIMNVSRIQADTPPDRRYLVDLARLVSQSVTTIGPAAGSAGVRVDCQIRGELPARVDPEQIRRALMGVLSNAVKFTPEHGRVDVSADRAGDDIVIRVEDTGIGVPDRDKGGLFTPFFRASNATDRALPGAGLGLAMAQTIVASHRGRIELVSTEGGGTTVTVHLPAAETSGLVQGRADVDEEGPTIDRLGD